MGTMTYEQGCEYMDIFKEFRETDPGYFEPRVEEDVIEKAKEILKELEGDRQPYILPTFRNTIQFEWELDNYACLEAEIYQEKVIVMWLAPSWNGMGELEYSSKNSKHSTFHEERWSNSQIDKHLNIISGNFLANEGELDDISSTLLNVN